MTERESARLCARGGLIGAGILAAALVAAWCISALFG